MADTPEIPTPEPTEHPDDHGWAMVAAVAVAVFAALPLFLNPGFLNTRGGGDSPFLLFRLHQLVVALADGHFPVRWMPDAAYGLGYPFYHFYAALPLYVAALLKLWGFSYVLSLKLTHLLGFMVAAWGTWGWLKTSGRSPAAAWLGAAAYTFAPFHFVNVYVRGDSIAEFGAMAIFPLTLWAAAALREQPGLRRAALLGLTYGALILSHNVSAMIFSPFLLGYFVWLFLATRLPDDASLEQRSLYLRQRELYAYGVGLALVLALGLAAFFFVPTLAERGIAQLETVTTGYFSYTQHFRTENLIQPTLLFNYDIGDPTSTPFAMGLVQALFLLPGFVGLFFTRDRQGLFVLLALILSTFMLTAYSELLWANLPLLPLTQFPWRFLSIQALFGAALLAEMIGKRPAAWHWPVALLAGLALAVSVLLPLRLDFVTIRDADVTARQLQTYEYFTGNIGTTIRYEYLPVWTQPRPYSSGEYVTGKADLLTLEGTATGERLLRRTARQDWQIAVLSDRAVIALPLLYWPGWTATVDGQPLAIGPVSDLGWTVFELPGGTHTVRLELRPTTLRLVTLIVSAIAAVAALALVVPWASLPALATGLRAGGWRWLLGVLVLAAVVALGERWLADRPATGAQTMDFAQYGYLHHDRVPFENGATLQDYTYSAEALAPGDTLTVTATWENLNDPYTLTLVGPGANFFAADVPIVAAASPPGSVSRAELTLPEFTPPGIYFLTLTFDNAQALTDTQQTRGDLYLRPVRVLPATVAAVTQPTAVLTEGLALADVSAYQPADDQVVVTPRWQLSRPLPINLAIALRLYDQFGVELAAYDGPAGNGLNPTYLWPVGGLTNDAYRLRVPLGLEPGRYNLTLTLYNATTLAPVATTTQPITLSRWSSRGSAPLIDVLPGVALSTVNAPVETQAGQVLLLQPVWASQTAPRLALQVRWWLAETPNGVATQAVASVTLPLRADQWPDDSLVRLPARLPLPPDLPSGGYSLRMQLLDAAGQPVSTPLTINTIQVTGIAGIGAAIPDFENPLDVRYGEDQIALIGYNIDLRERTLNLELFFRAEAPIERNLKYFVHVYDPFNEDILVQHDAIPGAGGLPTLGWVPGMVIAEEITLDLTPLATGQAYNIGIGWYDEESGARLLATLPDGRQLPFNRAVLDFAILFNR